MSTTANLSPARKQRDQEDRKRMQYRRAIEAFAEQRRLEQDIIDIPDLIAANAQERSSAPWQSQGR